MVQREGLWVALLAILFLFVSSQLFAQEEIVKKRKDLMQSNNAAVKAINKAVQEKECYSRNQGKRNHG